MRKILSMLMLCTAVAFTACSDDDDKTVAVTGVTLDQTTLSVEVGKTATLVATLAPEDAAEKSVSWDSSDKAVATVADGVVTALKAGETTITVTTKDGGKTATCTVTVSSAGPTWATGNLVADGANGAKIGTATDKGLYFQFGSLIGWSTADPLAIVVKPAAFNGKTDWADKGKIWQGTTGVVPFTATGSDDEKAGIGDPCRYYLKDTWRLPTKDEYAALFNNTEGDYANSGGWSWKASPASIAHTDGLTFSASGCRYSFDSALFAVDDIGYYWSASPKDANDGHFLNFSSYLSPSNFGGRQSGYSVRCVKD